MTDNEIFENNLTHFQVVKKYQDRAQCKCPAHQDKQASLTVTKGRKCTLLYCHAGCQLDDILNAAGLEKRDIFYESTQNTANWRASSKSVRITGLKRFIITFPVTVNMLLQK